MSAFIPNVLFHGFVCCWLGVLSVIREIRRCFLSLGRNECHQWNDEHLLVVFSSDITTESNEMTITVHTEHRMHCMMTEKYALEHFKIAVAAGTATAAVASLKIRSKCRKWSANSRK